MIELLAIVFVIVIVIVTIRLGRQDDAPSSHTSQSSPTLHCAGGLSEGLAFARQHAEQAGDTEAVQAIDSGTYKELLEQRASKRQAPAPDGVEYCTFDIAGINYRKGIADYVGQSTGYLKPQPSNRHDPNAIAIYADDDHHLGYIREYETDDVRALRLRFPIPVSVFIEECYDDDENRRFFVGQVTIRMKKKTPQPSRRGI